MDFVCAEDYFERGKEIRDNLEICRQKLFDYDDYVKYKYEVEEEQKKC